MVDQLLLNDTLQKINGSLNKRFEKDADLYISRQDEYEIKKNLCNEAYGGIVDMAKAKSISHDIIVKVIMRNAGVLNVRDIKKFKKELKPVLEDANYRALTYMMEDVLGNNVFMQKKLRHVLFAYYMKGITSKARVVYWKRGPFEFDITERSVLFNLIIEKTNHKDASKTLPYKIDFIQDAFQKYPSLMKENAFCKLKETLDNNQKKELFKYLCKEMEEPSIDNDAYNFILVDAYASFGENAFNDAVNQIRATSPRNFKQYIKVICKLIRGEKEKDQNTILRMFDNICKIYESPYIKNHVRKEIERKVWKAAKYNKVLYDVRKVKIDSLMAKVEQEDKSKYASFADVAVALSSNAKPKNIAYFWLNMKTPDFEQSVLESFTKLNVGYLMSMKETYQWLFNHSLAKGRIRELNKTCERMALPLHEFRSMNKSSVFFDALDNLWVDFVVKYKLQGKKIEAYMFEEHFEHVKEWK